MTNPMLNRARPDILAMKGYSSARSMHKKKPGMIFLDANECPYEPCIGIQDFARYPDQQPAVIVDALCRMYDVSSRNLAITRGADEAIDLLVRAFCVPAQDNIIVCMPGFSMYAHSATLQGASVKTVPLTEGFGLDVENIKTAADENTKLVFVCSPNNPTANLMNGENIKALCDHFDGQALVVVDETYIEFSQTNESFIPAIESRQNLVVLRTLSKSYASAGLRCGVAMAQQDIISLLLKVLPPYPIPAPVAQAAAQILTPKNLKKLAQKREELLARKETYIPQLEALDDVEEIFPSVANFILMRVKDADAFSKKCLAKNIIVRNQSHQLNLENCIRISMGTEEEMAKLMAVLRDEDICDAQNQRTAKITRNTKETKISVDVNLDKNGPIKIDTGVPFYDHMIEQIAKHGGFSLIMECEGDLDIEAHHTVEDCAIALGQALKTALGDKMGISRFGSDGPLELILPMDEAQARIALDLSGRFQLEFDAEFPDRYVGNKDNPLPVDMIEHVFRSLAENLQANLHMNVVGENTHHMVEICFKGLGRALRQAIRVEGTELPSTKGLL